MSKPQPNKIDQLLEEFHDYCEVYWDLIRGQSGTNALFRHILDKKRWPILISALKYAYGNNFRSTWNATRPIFYEEACKEAYQKGGTRWKK